MFDWRFIVYPTVFVLGIVVMGYFIGKCMRRGKNKQISEVY